MSFDLDKKFTILYGDNGFGKSTFFDAIEWGMTGSISRFMQNDQDKDFENTDLINGEALKTNESICSVSLHFGNYRLKRYFTTDNGKTNNTYVELNNNSLVNGDPNKIIFGKANVEGELKTIFMRNIKDNSSFNIKQPFVLSQDQVTDFVLKDKPKQRYKALANLVGLNKIVNYSDNFRSVIRELNSSVKELNETVMKTQAIIDSNSSYKPIYFEEIIFEAREIPIKLPKEPKDYQIIINESRHSYNSMMINIRKQIKHLEKYSEINNMNFILLLDRKKRLKEYASRLDKHISLVKEINNNLNKKIIKLEEQEEYNKNFEELRKQLNDLSERILSKQHSILNLGYAANLEIGYIDSQIKDISKKLEAINFHLSFYDDYQKVIKENNEFPSRIFTTSKILDNLNRRKKQREKWLEKIVNWIEDNSDKSEQLKLFDLLKGIKEYLNLREEKNKCPVCSTDKEGKLIEISNENFKKIESLLEQQTGKMRKALDLKSKIEDSINKIKNDIKKLGNTIDEYNRMQNKNLSHLSRITNDNKFNILYMQDNKEFLINEVKKLNKDYEKLNNLKTYILQLKELERRERTQRKNLEEISKLISVKSSDLLQSYKKTLKKRVGYLDKIRITLSQLNKEYDDLNLEINMLKENEIEIDGIPFVIKLKKFEKEYNELQEKIEKIEKVNQKYVDFQKAESTEIILQKAREEQKLAKDKLKYINERIEIINKYIDELNEKVGSQAIDFLNKENSSVQQLYRYLNPMVSAKKLKFIAEEEELSIRVSDDNDSGKETSAKYILSSGQMNVLALSIFLAVNESMDSDLDFVAIDDPIQNMDDVNQYSVCDVLSNLKRQVIFSTHDLDFVKLFVKKNEHLNGVIQVYMLNKPVISSNDSYERIIFGEVMKV
ncbi:AAA family ATPase [Metabacillus sp. HB246100]